MATKKTVLVFTILLFLLSQTIPATAAEHGSFEDYKAWESRDEPAPPIFDETDVVVLNRTTFLEFVNNTKYVMVEFYAPWCGHSQSLAPEYAAAATELKEGGSDVVLAKVDAIDETELADRFKIGAFPTIYLFADGQHISYEGERTKDAIVSWLKKKTGIPVQSVTSTEEARKILSTYPKIVLAFLENLTGSESHELKAAAEAEEDVNFYQTTSPSVADMFEIDPLTKRPALVLLKKEAEKLSVFDGGFSRSEIIEFVSTNKHPLVITFSRATLELIFENPLSKQMLLFVRKNESAELLPPFQETAIAFKDKLIFVYVDTDNEDFGKAMIDHFGIEGDAPRVVAYAGHTDGRKFQMDGDLTFENIKLFSENFLADKLHPFYKSDPIPETNNDDVKIVVGKNFDDIVLDESKDVLLEIYASWCPHCRALEPIYNQLGKHMRGVDSVVIAKMNGVTNEHPNVKAAEFPTILFFPAGKKSSAPIIVDTEGTVVALYEFLRKHASAHLEALLSNDDDEQTLEDVARTKTTADNHDNKDEL